MAPPAEVLPEAELVVLGSLGPADAAEPLATEPPPMTDVLVHTPSHDCRAGLFGHFRGRIQRDSHDGAAPSADTELSYS